MTTSQHDERTIEAMNKVFGNPLLVQEIVQELIFPDLKKIRPVSRSFKTNSDNLVMRSSSSIVRISKGRDEKNYQFSQTHDHLWKIRPRYSRVPLNHDFIVAHKSNFPRQNFALFNIELTDPKIFQLVELVHDQMDYLYLHDSRMMTKNTNWNFPNVTKIELSGTNNLWSTNWPLSLPKLKSVAINWRSMHLLVGIDPTTLHLEEFECELDNTTPDRHGTDVLKCRMVQEIVDVNQSRLKVFGITCNSRQEIYAKNMELRPPCLKFPPMVRLVSLKLSGTKDSKFFQNLDLSLVFPVLRTLKLSGECVSSSNTWTEYFGDFRGCLRSVTSIEISSKATTSWMTWLKDLCPNLSHFRLRGITNIYMDLAKVARSLPGLQSLDLLFNDLPTDGLDSVFTGLPTDACDALRKSLTSFDEDKLNSLRNRRSLLNLNGLKKLGLYFNYKLEDIEAESNSPFAFISIVSCHFAFQKMSPKLNVTLGYDHGDLWLSGLKSKLEAIRPFVKIVHLPQRHYPPDYPCDSQRL